MNLKKIVEISPLIGAFLIFNGFLKLNLFYSYWEINIIEYLNFSEIILSFLDDIKILILFFLTFLIHQLIGLKLIDSLESKSKVKSDNGNIDTLDKPKSVTDSIVLGIENYSKFFITISFIAFMILFVIFIYYHKIIILYFAFAALFQFIFLLIGTKDINISLVVTSIISFLMFTCAIAYSHIKEVENSSNEMTIALEDEKIVTSKTYYFLGKTENFMFLYDNLNKTSRIIPNEQIKNIEIRRIIK